MAVERITTAPAERAEIGVGASALTAARPVSNALAGETSPYLRGHANNPVDWLPWGEQARWRAHGCSTAR